MDTTSDKQVESDYHDNKKMDINGDKVVKPKKNGKLSISNGNSSTSRYGRTIRHVIQSNDNKNIDNQTLKLPKPEPKKNNLSVRKSDGNKVVSNSNEDVAMSVSDDTSHAADNISVVSLETLEASEEILMKKSWWKKPDDTLWKPGQLAWAQVSTFPYWPCVITLDPDLNRFVKWRAFGKSVSNMIHVQYFGDKGRHNWVAEASLMPFLGLASFKKLVQEWYALPDSVRKKDLKKTAGYRVKPYISAKWSIAVQEAEPLLAMELEERLNVLKPQRKRERSDNSINLEIKKVKLDNIKEKPKIRIRLKNPNIEVKNGAKNNFKNGVKNAVKNGKLNSNDSKKPEIDDDARSVISVDGEIPPTPPSSHKDSSDESVVIRKVKIKRIKKVVEPIPSFDIYYNRNKEGVANVSPDSTEDDIKTYLKKSWENMSEQARMKYIPQVSERSKQSSTDRETNFSDEPAPKRKRGKKNSIGKDESIVETVKKTRIPNLFRGTKAERVCQICEKTGNLIRCKGPCYSHFHLKCVKPGESESECNTEVEDNVDDKSLESSKIDDKSVKNNKIENKSVDNSKIEKSDSVVVDEEENNKKDSQTEEETFKCIDCLSGVAPACFVCNEREDERIKCSVMACGKHYHAACLKYWPQSQLQGDRLNCPYHTCHTCISDNPQNGYSRAPNEKIIRCVRCPSAYHASTTCLPAGSEIITGSQMICPKHYKASHPPLNATWCFLCTRGGSLICCDTCPTSFHADCLGINAPDGAFICEDCETGRLPLYGEIVWVKLGTYRWWPSRICFPHEIPSNIQAVSHKPGEFCVIFLGTLNYYWVHRGRVFLYQDGDSNVKSSVNKSGVDGAFREALKEANELHERLKREKKEDEIRAIKPPHFVKLKINKPVGNVKPADVDSIVACECDSNWDTPCDANSDCLNRILSIECSPGICPAGSKCCNQSFARREYPVMEPFHTRARGWGLKTLENIKSGQFVIEYVGEVIDEAEYKRRIKTKKELRNENYYFLTIDNYRMIDAELKGNLSRFMNHSCQPNCETQKWTVNGDTRIGLFALRDIEVGEELTFNYNLASDGEKRKPCLCGAPNCSGFIGLKAQKLSLTPTTTGPQIKSKRGRRPRMIYKCWRCSKDLSDREEFVICDLRTCSKRYHKKCVTVQGDASKFSCPWHHCLECNKRCKKHCTYCPIAYCQNHIEGKLKEYKGEKGSYVCKVHEDSDDSDLQKSLPPEIKVDSDNDIEADRESLLADSDSPISELLPKESSPRVSIAEVQESPNKQRRQRNLGKKRQRR
ncbi:histone-lysine N-methyltransferase NSD2 isoform X1 [Cotesia glomerata]|uniref:histone-lysine N-methyltransferase NSD2 isoform X1 n=1 Tax=Cotesia glomerata TaxID=32391 RepID=UPI001D023D16|nr:histone-lysine N-methyltransferase NSD2 isoform X1 [Cotesia glomerata]